MSPDQQALALYSCRECGVELEYQGVGRPPAYCAAHRPGSFPPLVGVPRAARVRQELNGELNGGRSGEPDRGLARRTDAHAAKVAAALPGKIAMKWRFLVALVDGGPQTDREVAARLGVPYTTCGPRRPALIEAGYVEPADLPPRPTGDGGTADVYRATASGIAKAREILEAK